MGKLRLTNRASYKAYWEDIAIKNKAIDGYRHGDKKIIQTNNRSDLPKTVLWATPYDNSQYGDKFSDNVLKTKQARIAILKVVGKDTTFDDEDIIFDQCEELIEQVVAKIILDKRGEVMNAEWTMLVTNISSMTGGPVEMTVGSTRYFGWELKFNFMDNANMAYDASKWD